MTLEERVKIFVEEKGYTSDPHVLGIIFYGSSLTGYNRKNSDIDIQIIYDDSNPEHITRGNRTIYGKRIEYFERPLGDIYLTVDNAYINRDNSPVPIYGKGKVIYQRDNKISDLRQYVLDVFSKPLPRLTDNEAKEQVSIINNRMEKLRKYADTNDLYFEHLFHLTIEKIRRFYHDVMGLSMMEVTKAFRLYIDEGYRKSLCIDKIPEQEFLDMYFYAITESDLSPREKYKLVSDIYDFSRRNIELGREYRIPIKSRSIVTNDNRKYPEVIRKNNNTFIPSDVLSKIKKFIDKMNYLNNPHCLGVIVCGSSITGYSTKDSDIDLQVIFDDTIELIRGNSYIDGTRIEYFEKPITDIYNSIDSEVLVQNNALYSIIGKGIIVFEKRDDLSVLQTYANDVFSKPLPRLTDNEAKEQVSIINNRMEKLYELAINSDPRFNHLYHLLIERIRKLYHRILGIPKVTTSKVYKIYTDEGYRNSTCKINPEQEFIKMYTDLITNKSDNKMDKYQLLVNFYRYVTRGINLGDDYCFTIKSRNTTDNTSHIQYVKSGCIND